MLHYSDQAELIRITRIATDADGKATRTRIGTLSKQHPGITPELRLAASAAELEEIEQVARHYAGIGAIEARFLAAHLPETLRIVVQYYDSGADPAERRLIADAITDAARALRRADKAADEAGD